MKIYFVCLHHHLRGVSAAFLSILKSRVNVCKLFMYYEKSNICLELAAGCILLDILFNVPNRNEAMSSGKSGWRGNGVQGIVCAVVAVVSKRSRSVVLGSELFVRQEIECVDPILAGGGAHQGGGERGWYVLLG